MNTVTNAPSSGAKSPASQVLDAYRHGYAAQLLTGRSLYDFVVHEASCILTLLEHLRVSARRDEGLHMITYAVSRGLDWDEPRLRGSKDADTIVSVLRAHGLADVPRDQYEAVTVMRGVGQLMRTKSAGATWADGRPMRFLVLFEFADHLVPSDTFRGRTDQEIATAELAHVLGQSPALRESGNLVVWHGRDGRLDPLVTAVLHPVRLPQPALVEKLTFIAAARSVYPTAAFETGLSNTAVAKVSANTPNRSVEGLLRASARSGKAITVPDLLEAKRADVLAMSEGTLSVLDVRRVMNVELAGRNVRVPQELLRACGRGLLAGNPLMPANVLMVGPPGTGKTDLALIAAQEAKVSAYAMHSPKGGNVGDTERRAPLMTRVLAESTPNVAFADEISEMLPMERSDFDGDSGASRAVTAELLTALSDESRRGRSLIIGSTNCPWRIGAAMRSRFTIVPVLSPLAEDYAEIVRVIAKRVAGGIEVSETLLGEAAQIFYRKGASPREILGAIAGALAFGSVPSSQTVLEAALDACPHAERGATELADLWALKVCSSYRFLPWYGQAQSFPFPQHLMGVVDSATGEILHAELEYRIQALKPAVNL